MGTYIDKNFINLINKNEVNTIFECGSRDCIDAIEMLDYYEPKIIYSFECNPDSVLICENNIKNYNKIKLIPKATYSEKKEIDFFMTDMERSIDKNIGASSLLYHRDNKNKFFQKKVSVDAIRLDEFMDESEINEIDLLCLDLQGSEMETLTGLGDKIKNVKYIITEVSFKSYYVGDKMFNEINKFLEGHNFKCEKVLNYGGFGDALFIRK